MRDLKLSTAANVMVFMTDDSDHVSGKTGLTLTITASKNGAAFASITPTVTERGSGWYNLALTTSHTDTLGDLAIHITGTAADPSDFKMPVVAYDPANADSLGLSRLDATISSRSSHAAPNLSALALEATAQSIKGKTDNLPTDPADESTIHTKLDAIAGYVDTEVAAIKAKTDNLPASPAAVSDIPSVSGIPEATAALILLTPSNKIATDNQNRVSATASVDTSGFGEDLLNTEIEDGVTVQDGLRIAAKTGSGLRRTPGMLE